MEKLRFLSFGNAVSETKQGNNLKNESIRGESDSIHVNRI